MDNRDIRSLAFFLPQFHPIAENDEWWGKGFTEWTNVTKSTPQFEGHQQPRLPADLGFYDLRSPDTRALQAELARTHDVDGFVYYHYWFNGRQVLEQPVNDILESGAPDFPFALCWANEDWRRNWNGRTGEVLLEQHYSEDDDRAHIEWLLRAFKDPRYIRVDGKPLFLVYRVGLFPNAARTAEIWRQAALDAGVGELYLCYVEGMERLSVPPEAIGFDASVEFAPDWEALGDTKYSGELTLSDYPSLAQSMLAKPDPGYRRFPCVSPGFDNSPRNGAAGFVTTNTSPAIYESWLAETVKREVAQHPGEEHIVFVNAWNEWAEGAILEPCSVWGMQYLEAHKRGIAEGLGRKVADVTIAVVTEGNASALMQTLQSAIATRGDAHLEFVVVDNASSDETAAVLEQLRDDVVSKRNDTAVPEDTAWQQARELASANVMAFASPDAIFTPGWLDQALTELVASSATRPVLLASGIRVASR